ncbi:DUF6445 family protein [Pseudomarimonas salicorniae]|uniref:DUF6445 family protein n=1 Tax=Pseudomarimonas salicorniae TaxID=2933270 RepID=A0ABT0GFJ7_9GAMM|nr:DUF6445 family protein [Lysobacter sp. CAU 1642]MCK7593306.1 DUF6445 family protein [Lysobacter sp. CAU 1642]
MLNPRASVSVVEAAPDIRVWVVDDALSEPERWVERASQHREAFASSDKDAYPGVQLALPDAVSQRLDELFGRTCRSELGARRTLGVFSRLALVTRQPEQLEPRQWICHRDRFSLPPEQCAAASVLYLFRDPRLGGTNFFRPRRPAMEVARLVHDSGQLSPADFSARYGITAGYMRDSSDWFEHALNVPPRWNRLIFYDGGLFHCSDIPAPELLDADPARGRLTLNGFFTCRRRAG